AIRRPVGFDDVVSNFARGPAGERNSSQRAAAAAAIAVKQHGQLRRLGDAEEFRVLDAQRAGLRSLAVGHVDFGGLTVPCRAVDGATGGTAAVPRIVRTVGVGPPAGTAVASVGC